MDERCFAQIPLPLRILGGSEVAKAWFTAQQLSRSG